MTPLVVFLLIFVLSTLVLTKAMELDSRHIMNTGNTIRELSGEITEPLSAAVESDNGAASDVNTPSSDPLVSFKTATGGFVHRAIIFCTIVAFLGNALFMINVFCF